MAKRITLNVSERYARALIGVAFEEKNMDKIKVELDSFSGFLKSSTELKSLLFKEVFSVFEKKEVLKKLFEKIEISDTTKSFLLYLTKQNRFYLFFDIVSQFNKKLDELLQISEVEVFSASALTKTIQKRIDEYFEKWIGKKARIIYKVNENLIGGLVTKIGNTIFDGSVQTQLRLVEHHLLRSETYGH